MKRLKSIVSAVLIGSTLFITTGCFGSFGLTKAFYQWNDGVTEKKFVKSLVMWGMLIIPFYEVGLIADFFILNLIEFWSGSNPISMKDGQKEVQFATVQGEQFEYVVTKNKFKITQLTGEDKGQVRIMRWNPDEKAWYYKNGDKPEEAVMSFLQDKNGESITRVYTKMGFADFRSDRPYSSDQLTKLFEQADQRFLAVNDR